MSTTNFLVGDWRKAFRSKKSPRRSRETSAMPSNLPDPPSGKVMTIPTRDASPEILSEARAAPSAVRMSWPSWPGPNRSGMNGMESVSTP